MIRWIDVCQMPSTVFSLKKVGGSRWNAFNLNKMNYLSSIPIKLEKVNKMNNYSSIFIYIIKYEIYTLFTSLLLKICSNF